MVVAGALAARGASVIPLVAVVASAGLTGGAAREFALTRAIRRREVRILAELPTVADMLALSVSAGEGALGAIERVTRTASGFLVEELRWTLGEVRTGTPVTDSLLSLSERTGVAALSRFASGVAIAIERGTPLADVLHSQALDVREAGRRRLIEEGGKREIAMMVPVIFLLLPVTVVFAVFPGIVAIHLGT
jgi:tight adherence protein C